MVEVMASIQRVPDLLPAQSHHLRVIQDLQVETMLALMATALTSPTSPKSKTTSEPKTSISKRDFTARMSFHPGARKNWLALSACSVVTCPR